MNKSLPLVTAVATATVFLGQTTQAQEGATLLEEVIVTANRREQNLQIVPIAVSAVSGEQLKNARVESLDDLSTLVSGYVGPGEAATLSPQIRGVGSQLNAPGREAPVALYVDGVYIGATSPAALNLNSVQQVEVLKGPQGTLFGRNTTAGLINVTTRNPGDETEIELEFGYGNFETATASAYLSGRLSDSIAANLAITTSSMGEGWGTNLATGSPNNQLDEEWSIRTKWDFQLGENTSLRLMADYQLREDLNHFLSRHQAGNVGISSGRNPDVPVLANTYIVPDLGWDANTFRDVTGNSEAWGATATFIHDFESVTLTNILAYRDTQYDLDSFIGNLSPDPANWDIQVAWETTNKQLTNELRLSSAGDEKLDWTVGVFYYDADDIRYQPSLGAPPPIGRPFDQLLDADIFTESWSVFGQVDYELAPGTTLTAGIRFNTDETEQVGVISTFNPLVPLPPFLLAPQIQNADFSRDSESYRLALAHQFTDDVMAYVSYNRGVKSGGWNPTRFNEAPIEDEVLDAYEIGAKMELADGRVRLNLAAFYYEYENVQLNSFFEPGPPNQFNGAPAELYGLDMDLVVTPTEQLQLFANMSALSSEFETFPDAEIFVQNSELTGDNTAAGSTVFVGDATGNDLPLSPELIVNLGFNYRLFTNGSGSYNLNSTYSYNSGYFGSPGNETNNEQDGFSRLSASVQYASASGRYTVQLWGRNLTDEEYFTQLNYTAAGPTGQLGAPRTYGLTFGVNFN